MPVVLTEPEEWEARMAAPWAEAKAVQRQLAAHAVNIVGRGMKKGDGTTTPGRA